MSSLLALARPDILELQPYQHAAWDPSHERMHANEMPWRAQGDNSDAGLNRYPEPQPRALVERMARLYDVPASQLLVGRGSDEAIDLLVRAFCRAGIDSVVTCPPTFGFYKVAARIQGAAVIEVPLRGEDFLLDTRGVIGAGARAKIVFLCSPNNPTGRLLDEPDILAICRALEGRALVCLDEAYLEFSGRASLASRIGEYPNLVILRTLSKAYALAGARCGTLVAAEDTVALLKRIIPPYAIPSSTVEDVLRLTEAPQQAISAERIRTILEERERMRLRLANMPSVLQVFDSDANFLLVRFRDARSTLEAGKSAGLLVRDFSTAPRLEGCLRISIGTPEQNERLLAAVERA
ncbi:MAG: histidinol-phosphate transaminase [Steroidobacteraceae bacterium]|nr:histidinol-phosphate transaminase [Steroidobacteraceae bacterium]